MERDARRSAAAPPTTEAPRELLAEIERRVTRFAHAAIDYVQERSGGLSAETALMAHMDQRRGEIMSAVRLALREAREEGAEVVRRAVIAWTLDTRDRRDLPAVMADAIRALSGPGAAPTNEATKGGGCPKCARAFTDTDRVGECPACGWTLSSFRGEPL